MLDELKNKLDKDIKCQLTDEEIKMLYGIDYDIDSSLEYYRIRRSNMYNDLIRIFDKKAVATKPEDISEKTLVYIGSLSINNVMPVYNLRYVYGILSVSNYSNLDNLEKVFGLIIQPILPDEYEKRTIYKFENLDYCANNERDYMLENVKLNGWLLAQASDDVRDDLEVVLAAVKNDYNAFRTASNRIKTDVESVKKAAKIDGRIISFVPDNLRDNKEIVLEAVKNNGTAFMYASDTLKNDDEFCLEIVIIAPRALLFCSDDIKNNKKIVLEAVRRNGTAIQLASDELKDDKEVVMEAIKNNYWSIEFISDRLKDDLDIAKEAVEKDVKALAYVSDNLRDNEELILYAMKINLWALHFATKRVKDLIMSIPGMAEKINKPVKTHTIKLK